MHFFEFSSAGIRVVFRGESFCLTSKMLADFEYRYVGRVSERTLQSMLVVSQNVSALIAHAKRVGRQAVFATTTFCYDNAYMQEMGWSKELTDKLRSFRSVLRKLSGLECVWALERNGKNARLHEQEVWSGFLELGLVEQAKWKVEGIGRCKVKEGFDPFYLNKEMGKRVGCRGNGGRHFGAMGQFAGKCGVRDFVLDSPMAECRRLAWAERPERAVDGWEPHCETWERARRLFDLWLAGKLSLGAEYDKYRETMQGFEGRRVGDAYEDGDGDTEFAVDNLDADGGGGTDVEAGEAA